MSAVAIHLEYVGRKEERKEVGKGGSARWVRGGGGHWEGEKELAAAASHLGR